MLRKFILLFILYFLTSSIFAQSLEQQADSIKQLIENATSDTAKAQRLVDLSIFYNYSYPKLSVQYAHKALAFSREINYSHGIYKSHLFLLNGHYSLNTHSDTLLKYIQSLEEFAQTQKDNIDILIGIYWNYAMYYELLNQTDKEIDAYLKALEMVRQSNTKNKKNNEAELLNNIGSLFSSNRKYKEALDYYNQALVQVEDKVSKANMLFNISLIYIDLTKIDSAQLFLNKAYELYKSVNNYDGIVTVFIEQGGLLDAKGEFTQAHQLYAAVLEMIETYGISHQFLTIYRVLADHYLLRKEYYFAIEYGEKALMEVKQQGNYTSLSNLYATLDEGYTAIGDFQKAHQIRGLLMAHNDSTSSAILQAKVEELQTEFKVEQTTLENELLKVNLKSRNILSLLLIIALIFATAWSISIFRLSQQRKKNNDLLEQKVAERTADLRVANKNLEQANKHLEQANYELRTFNYIASHDIKEPIRNIGSYAGLIFRKLPSDLKLSLGDYFQIIKHSTSQLYTLIEDFAKYTALSKNDKVDKQDVNLNRLMGSIQHGLSETIKKYNGEIIVHELPVIPANSSLLYTAIKNLIENGLKYNQSQVPTVEMKYNSSATHHEIIISDNGIGIEEIFHEKIFEMFKRLHNRGEYEGSGIGLAIVKICIEKLDGQIELKSEKGKGSQFMIRLPKTEFYQV